jgi:hypothetical protein
MLRKPACKSAKVMLAVAFPPYATYKALDVALKVADHLSVPASAAQRARS